MNSMDSELNENGPERHVLTTMYDITRRLFRYFPIRTVDLCSNVCRSWSEMSRIVMKNRCSIESYSYVSERENNSPTENVEPIEVESFNKSLSKFVDEKLWFLPSVVLIVTTNELDAIGLCSRSDSPISKSPRQSSSDRRVRRTKRVNLFRTLLSHLNRSCQVLMLVSEGVVTSDNENRSKEIESGFRRFFSLDSTKEKTRISFLFSFRLRTEFDFVSKITRESFRPFSFPTFATNSNQRNVSN